MQHQWVFSAEEGGIGEKRQGGVILEEKEQAMCKFSTCFSCSCWRRFFHVFVLTCFFLNSFSKTGEGGLPFFSVFIFYRER